MRQIATRCLALITLSKIDFDMKFVDYCEQAESTRETCSRDPAYYGLNISVHRLVDIFLKINHKGTKNKNKKKKENTRRLYVQGISRGLAHAVILWKLYARIF